MAEPWGTVEIPVGEDEEEKEEVNEEVKEELKEEVKG